MTQHKVLFWSPRILGILAALFVGLFARDAESLSAFLIHAMPTLVLLLVVAIAWQSEWVGGVVFIALSILYAAAAWPRADWVAVISGPLFGVGALYLWSWRHRQRLHAHTPAG